MKNLFFIIVFLSIAKSTFGEKPFSLNFIPVFNHHTISLNEKFYQLSGGDSIRFDVLKFYISSVKFMQDENIIYSEENSYHLIDCSASGDMKITMNLPDNLKFNKVKFNLGIDSTTNMSGVLGGDLDPTKGMYWTWQSGYVNFKLEGIASNCSTPNHEFQYHLGGYSFPDNSLRVITIEIKNPDKLDIEVDIAGFISALDFSSHPRIMSPGKLALEFSTIAARCFKRKQQ